MTVTISASSGTLGGFYGLIDLRNNATANKAKVIIPLGGFASDTNGFVAVATPYNKGYAGLSCKMWAVNAPTAYTYAVAFLCLI